MRQRPAMRGFAVVCFCVVLHSVSAVKIGFIGDSGTQTSSSSIGFHGEFLEKQLRLCSLLRCNLSTAKCMYVTHK